MTTFTDFAKQIWSFVYEPLLWTRFKVKPPDQETILRLDYLVCSTIT